MIINPAFYWSPNDVYVRGKFDEWLMLRGRPSTIMTKQGEELFQRFLKGELIVLRQTKPAWIL